MLTVCVTQAPSPGTETTCPIQKQPENYFISRNVGPAKFSLILKKYLFIINLEVEHENWISAS